MTETVEFPIEPDHSDLPLASDDLVDDDDKSLLFDEPCGVEDRVAIGNTGKSPWSGICFLVMKKRWGTYRGTGFFVSPTALVTAGHCIEARGGRARSIQVIPGRDGRNWPFSSSVATSFHLPREWDDGREAAFDYGVVRFETPPFPTGIHIFALANSSDEELEGAILHTAGYPSDMKLSTRLHYNHGPCGEAEPMRLQYMLDTWKGASGSPVWIEKEGTPHVVGIHNYGHCPNRATRLSQRVIDDISKWAAL